MDSEEAVGFEAERGGVADDQVVQETNADGRRRSLHRLGQLSVVGRGSRIATGVVMGENAPA